MIVVRLYTVGVCTNPTGVLSVSTRPLSQYHESLNSYLRPQEVSKARGGGTCNGNRPDLKRTSVDNLLVIIYLNFFVLGKISGLWVFCARAGE
jgi:hypothetical protein